MYEVILDVFTTLPEFFKESTLGVIVVEQIDYSLELTILEDLENDEEIVKSYKLLQIMSNVIINLKKCNYGKILPKKCFNDVESGDVETNEVESDEVKNNDAENK